MVLVKVFMRQFVYTGVFYKFLPILIIYQVILTLSSLGSLYLFIYLFIKPIHIHPHTNIHTQKYSRGARLATAHANRPTVNYQYACSEHV